jgi:hypothetical protein
MLSHLHLELLRLVRARPLVSVAVGRDRYSVSYSPPGSQPGSWLEPRTQLPGRAGHPIGWKPYISRRKSS